MMNANHIRYEYLFVPLPFPDNYFHYIVVGEGAAGNTAGSVPENEIARVLAAGGEVIRYANGGEGGHPELQTGHAD